MNTNTGDIEYFEDGKVPKEQHWVQVGDIVSFANARWRVTGMKPNGRLFLKLVKQ